MSDAEPAAWIAEAPPECAHCGRRTRLYGGLASGERVCHSDEGPDCYRRVTVYGEPLGALKGIAVLPQGVEAIIGGVVQVTEERAAVNRVPCPLCGAAKGEPCRTRDEFEAPVVHLARLCTAKAARIPSGGVRDLM